MVEIQWKYVKVTWLNTRHKAGGVWDSEYIRGTTTGRAFINAAEFINEQIKSVDHPNLSVRVLSKQEVLKLMQGTQETFG